MSSTEPWSFEDISAPIVKAIRFAYNMQRKNKKKDVPWKGLLLTKNDLLACNFNIDESLKRTQLDYDKNEQGRDALTVIVGCAIRLGIEQGLRMRDHERERHNLLENLKEEKCHSW